MELKNVEKKEKNTVELVVEVSADEFDKAVASAYNKNKSKISVPGFRKGKAPRKIIENMYGEGIFYEDAISEIAPDAYSFAVEKEGIHAVGKPSIENADISDEKALTLTFLSAVYPEVKMGKYKGITVECKKPVVEDKDVDMEIDHIRRRNARFESVDRPAENGDTVVIDFDGYHNGEAFEGAKGTDYNLVLGSNSFIPGFEEQLIGASAGEDRELNVVFPENYAKDLAGKDALFKVHVKEVKESILPELDDEFAKDVSEFDTLDEYKKSIHDNLLSARETIFKEEYMKALMDKIVDGMEVELPDAMVDEQTEKMLNEYAYELSSKGIAIDKYIEMLGMTQQEFIASSRVVAERQLKIELAIEKIAELENIQVSAEDIEAEYQKMAENYGTDIETVKKVFDTDYITKMVKSNKAGDLIQESGIVVEPTEGSDKTDEKKAATKKPASKKRTTKKTVKKEEKKEETAEEVSETEEV